MRRIKQYLIQMEYDLSMPVADSIQHISIKVPNSKLHVVIIGNNTRLAQAVLNQPAPVDKPAANQFVIYE